MVQVAVDTGVQVQCLARVDNALQLELVVAWIGVVDAAFQGQHIVAAVGRGEHIDIAGERLLPVHQATLGIEDAQGEAVARQTLVVEVETLAGRGCELVEPGFLARLVDQGPVVAQDTAVNKAAAAGFVHAPVSFQRRLAARQGVLVVGGDVLGATRHAPQPHFVDLAAPGVIAAGTGADAQCLGGLDDGRHVAFARHQHAVHVQLESRAVIGTGDVGPGVGRQVGADFMGGVTVDEEMDAAVGVVGQAVTVAPTAVAALHEHRAPVGQRRVLVDPGLHRQLVWLEARVVGHRDIAVVSKGIEGAIADTGVGQRRSRAEAHLVGADTGITQRTGDSRVRIDRLRRGHVQHPEGVVTHMVALSIHRQGVGARAQENAVVAADIERIGTLQTIVGNHRAVRPGE